MENYRDQGNLYFQQFYSSKINAGYLVVALIEGLALQWMVDPDNSRKKEIKNLVEYFVEEFLMGST